MGQGTISHTGVIEAINSSTVSVNINSVSACSACHAKGACSASDMQEKIVEAVLPIGKKLRVGDMVTVQSKESVGYKALFLGYILPFLLVMASLITCTALNIKETTSGFVSLSVLIPYYLVLYLNKNSIKKSFIFEIQQ